MTALGADIKGTTAVYVSPYLGNLVTAFTTRGIEALLESSGTSGVGSREIAMREKLPAFLPLSLRKAELFRKVATTAPRTGIGVENAGDFEESISAVNSKVVSREAKEAEVAHSRSIRIF